MSKVRTPDPMPDPIWHAVVALAGAVVLSVVWQFGGMIIAGPILSLAASIISIRYWLSIRLNKTVSAPAKRLAIRFVFLSCGMFMLYAFYGIDAFN